MNDMRLRLKIEDSIKEKIVSANALICCIAALNHRILASKQNLEVDKHKREALTKITLNETGLSKNDLANKIIQISDGCYPSLKAISRFYEMVAVGKYTVDNSFIPDNLLKFNSNKTTVQLKEPTPPEKHYLLPDEDFIEICKYFESEYNIEINNNMQRDIIKLSNEIPTEFTVISKAFQWSKKDIFYAIQKEFSSPYNKFKYILGVIKNNIPQTISILEHRKKQENELWEGNAQAILDGYETLESAISIQCDKYENSAHYGQHDLVRTKLLDAMKRIEERKNRPTETVVYLTDEEAQQFQYQKHEPAQFKPRPKNKNSEKYKELW